MLGRSNLNNIKYRCCEASLAHRPMFGFYGMNKPILSIVLRHFLFVYSAVCSAQTNAARTDAFMALPVLVFQTSGQAVQERTRVPGSLTLLTPNLEQEAAFTLSSSSGKAELSVRGNSSFYYPKKSYRLELQTAQGKDRKVSLLGMPADSDWVLYGSATDRTFVRNVLGQELWRSTGRYAVRWRFVEVFVITNRTDLPETDPHELALALPGVLDALTITGLSSAAQSFSNTQDHAALNLAESYSGLYLLMEKLKRGKNRVNIKHLRPEHAMEPEISGGYIIKKDDQGRGQRGLLTGQEFGLRYEEPKETELTAAQKQWMAKYLDDFEKALFGQGFRDPVNGYRKFIDVESFIDFHWLVEVAKNADGFMFSQYMHKDRGGKLTMGPVWDWDNAFGNPHFSGQRTNGWRFESATDPDYTWYRRLFEDPDFLQRYMDRWSELRTNIFATSNVLQQVYAISDATKGTHRRNAMLWEEGPNASIRARAGVTYDDEVRGLKEWLVGRLAWIDNQDFPKPVAQVLPKSESDPRRLALAWLTGRLFYTVDGSDPRVPGGGVSGKAIEYSAPIPETTNALVTARVRSSHGLWSAPTRVVLNGQSKP